MSFYDNFSVLHGFLAPEEIPPLLERLRALPYLHDVFRGQPIKRASAYFGMVYVAAGRRLEPAPGFADWLSALVRRASPYYPIDGHFEQCIVTRYGPGTGIGWHTDAPYFCDWILGVSIGGDGRLRFRPAGSKRATIEVTTTSGSLYLMQGEARWEYEHELVPVQEERFALTFRGLPSSLLRPPSPAGPLPGFRYERNFVTTDQANSLVRSIEENASRWEADHSRRAQRYGYLYNYDTRRVSRVGSLPEWLQMLARLIYDNGWMASLADQATVQEYEPGAGISDHYDDRLVFGKDVVTISLISACAYRLVQPEFGFTRELIVEPGSAVILNGEARSIWKHGIPSRKSDEVAGVRLSRSRRLSITFRTVNPRRISW